MTLIDIAAIDDIALGAAVLGSGGGGDPAISVLMAKSAIAKHGPITLLQLDEVPDQSWLLPPAVIGAPTVTFEKLPAGGEASRAYRALERFLGVRGFGVYPSEIGGGNSLVPVPVAAELGLPMIDADMMGRAFPEVQMTTANMAGVTATPMSMADEKGTTIVFETLDSVSAERLGRALSIRMGGSAFICNYAMSGFTAKQCLIRGSVSYAHAIGQALRASWSRKTDPVESLIRMFQGRLLIRGKIGDLERRTERGFSLGEVTIHGSGTFAQQEIRIAFQNENIVVWLGQSAVVTTPDLISILDDTTGQAITTESLRFGQRVAVLGIPCDPKWRTPRGLELTGPRYFGYDIDYSPIEERQNG